MVFYNRGLPPAVIPVSAQPKTGTHEHLICQDWSPKQRKVEMGPFTRDKVAYGRPMPKISARTFVMLYWGGQALAFLPGFWLTPQQPDMLRVLSGWATLGMCGVIALHALWIWQQLKVAVGPIAAANSRISRLLSRTRAVGRVSLAGFLILAVIKIMLRDTVGDPNSWLDSVFAVAFLGLLVSGGLAALCLCKAEVEITPQAKPSVFWTFWQFSYAGLTAGAIRRRVTRAADAAPAAAQPTASVSA